MQKLLFYTVATSFLLFGTLASAQEAPPEPPLNTNAESTAMIERFRQDVDGLKTPLAKAAALSQLMGFQLRFTDKAPAAETIRTLIALAEGLEKGPERSQILEAIVYAQSELGDYDGAVKTIDSIDKPQERAENQLTLAEKFLAEKEKKPAGTFDVVALLRKSLAAAGEAKDPSLEALVLAVLGGELAKLGKTDDAKTAFQQSREKAKELEELEERNILSLIVRNEVRAGLNAEAQTLIDSAATDETKASLTGIAVATDAEAGRFDAARKTLDTMKPGNAKDGALLEFGRASAKTESAVKLIELSKLLSSSERTDMFLRELIAFLAEENRFDVAEELAKASSKPEECRLLLSASRLESLIKEKKFDEAAKLVDTLTDPRLKTGAIHHLAAACVQAGELGVAESLLAANRSEDEKAALKELDAAATKAAEEKNIEVRTEAQFELLRSQLQLLDLTGAKTTLSSMVGSVRALEDPVQRVPNLLVLAQVLSQLGDKAQAKQILGELFVFLVGVKDPMTLKGLVPKRKPEAVSENADSPQPVLALDFPVDEAAVKEQLFILYANIANNLAKSGDAETAKKVLQQANEMLAAETEPEIKLQKTLLLAQIYAEMK